MTAPIISAESWRAAAEAIASYVSQMYVNWLPLIAVIAVGVLRLLQECQLRRTLGSIFEHAPGGSVIIVRKRGLGGSMWVHVGSGEAPGTRHGQAELR